MEVVVYTGKTGEEDIPVFLLRDKEMPFLVHYSYFGNRGIYGYQATAGSGQGNQEKTESFLALLMFPPRWNPDKVLF